MHFLVDADMPRATAGLLVGYGHVATDVRDIGMGSAKDPVIARCAKENRFCLVTGDWGFADVRVYPPTDYHGIVVVGVPDAASRAPGCRREAQNPPSAATAMRRTADAYDGICRFAIYSKLGDECCARGER